MRRHRTKFTQEQLDILEQSFETMRYPGVYMREDLARRLDLTDSNIQVWFKNRRAKQRSEKNSMSNKENVLSSLAVMTSKYDQKLQQIDECRLANEQITARESRYNDSPQSPDFEQFWSISYAGPENSNEIRSLDSSSMHLPGFAPLDSLSDCFTEFPTQTYLSRNDPSQMNTLPVGFVQPPSSKQMNFPIYESDVRYLTNAERESTCASDVSSDLVFFEMQTYISSNSWLQDYLNECNTIYQ